MLEAEEREYAMLRPGLVVFGEQSSHASVDLGLMHPTRTNLGVKPHNYGLGKLDLHGFESD